MGLWRSMHYFQGSREHRHLGDLILPHFFICNLIELNTKVTHEKLSEISTFFFCLICFLRPSQQFFSYASWIELVVALSLYKVLYKLAFFVVNDTPSVSEDYLPCARKVFTQHD